MEDYQKEIVRKMLEHSKKHQGKKKGKDRCLYIQDKYRNVLGCGELKGIMRHGI